MSRESFIAEMQRALGHALRVRQGQPAHGDLAAYFGTLRGNPVAALAAFEEYARSFNIHTSFVPGDRTGDVSWPGGSCDRWSEIVARPRHQHRRIIDCEGYAYLGAELMTSAGWRLRGYQVIYLLPTQTTGFDYHLMAVLDYAGPPPLNAYIGSQRSSPSAVTEASRVWPAAHFNTQFGSIEPTALRAIDVALRDAESGPQREIAPLRLRRSAVPSAL